MDHHRVLRAGGLALAAGGLLLIALVPMGAAQLTHFGICAPDPTMGGQEVCQGTTFVTVDPPPGCILVAVVIEWEKVDEGIINDPDPAPAVSQINNVYGVTVANDDVYKITFTAIYRCPDGLFVESITWLQRN